MRTHRWKKDKITLTFIDNTPTSLSSFVVYRNIQNTKINIEQNIQKERIKKQQEINHQMKQNNAKWCSI